MKIEIDQSGKIEQTELDTVIALSNKIKYTLILRRRSKRTLQSFFRQKGQPRVFIYRTFAALIAIVLSKVKSDTKIIIDSEYLSHKGILKEQIKHYMKSITGKTVGNFDFGFVGKNSNAHKLAGKVANRIIKADKIVSIEEVFKIIWPTKKIGSPRIRRTEGNLTQE